MPLNLCRPKPKPTRSPQLSEVLSAERNDMKDVGGQFVDDMLKGYLTWKSVEGRGLVRWGYMVLHKPVGGQEEGRAAGVA